MQGRLSGKALIVIGSGTGIGAATARRLAAEGARLCLADINLAAASAVAAEIAADGGEAFATFIDLADEPSVATAIEAAAERLGGLDGAHVNAADMRAIMQDSNALAEELEIFDRTLTVNLRGHLLCTRAVLPHLLARGGGALVYTSSAAADMGDPLRPAYAASKSGLNALMRHVAANWGRRGVTANCVAPGYVITPEMTAGGALTFELLSQMGEQTPSLRLGNPADIAAMVAMLLSDDGRWMNGQVYHVNGGALMR
ncbi:SDR family oxidoreductase [Sphingomonadales bacterium 56]|uniref:SDR family NAD(P)-dependent oxidoreductase n=1 Tax=unclassified Sphingobium TaxID=2611147 RepID=UPI001919A498|nr:MULTISPECIES: SDR family oxidoreductase [unclassified Sphingobium]MBY2928411.1 SDR family oxidoreductase [Sphingomonadales bacterium 56]MBY2958511.1 SDR family oxidoreductase [Sphingomonadales bacterium 58]CAD7337210.1 putative oxidoreductase [Sphingobium sp. S6]CAD7337242.1 putative oxidoreductase [Sphingobium sp. S8]